MSQELLAKRFAPRTPETRTVYTAAKSETFRASHIRQENQASMKLRPVMLTYLEWRVEHLLKRLVEGARVRRLVPLRKPSPDVKTCTFLKRRPNLNWFSRGETTIRQARNFRTRSGLSMKRSGRPVHRRLIFSLLQQRYCVSERAKSPSNMILRSIPLCSFGWLRIVTLAKDLGRLKEAEPNTTNSSCPQILVNLSVVLTPCVADNRRVD